MKNKIRFLVMMLIGVLLSVNQAWGADTEVTSVANIQDGGTYYIKGVRSSTTYYLSFPDAKGTQSGTESSSKDGAIAVTFNKVSNGVYTLKTPKGNYIAPGTSNGKINVSETAINVTASNQSSKIRLSITSSGTTWSIQKNSGAANFGGYKNTQTDITLIEAAAPATPHTVRFYKTDGTYTDLTEASVGAGVTPPTMQAACGDWEFQGWSKTESDDAESTDELILETLSSGKYYPSSNVTLYPVYTMEGTIESDVSDEITQSTTGLPTSGSGGYTAWSNKTVTSDAVYAGQSNKAVSYLQLRNQSPSGIISTSSGGILKKVTIAWNSSTPSGRYVTIFGKTSAYTECANLYNNTSKGTSLGTITYETSTELDNLNKDDEYTYVGVLASAAVYINKITITWAAKEDVTYYFSYPSCVSTYTLLFSGQKSGHFRAF